FSEVAVSAAWWRRRRPDPRRPRPCDDVQGRPVAEEKRRLGRRRGRDELTEGGRAGKAGGPGTGGPAHGCFQSTRSTTSRLGALAMSASTSEDEIVLGQLSYSFNQKRIRTNDTSGSPNRG